MITITNLRYTYPHANTETVRGLNFTIEPGEIFGFLGPSGAGKSTTQNILIGLLKKYQGTIQIMKRDLSHWRQDYYEHIGVSFELPNHYLKLTALENLQYFTSLYQSDTYNPMEVMEWVGLHNDAHKQVSSFSKGMKIRLNFARSILHKPKILFLDEPTSGLDPINACNIKDLILQLRDQGTTIFITTHDMTVADQLCDRVAFLTNGTISVIDSPNTLKKKYGKQTVQITYIDQNNTRACKEFSLTQLGHNQAFVQLLQNAHTIETIHTQETTLENIFIQVTGQQLTNQYGNYKISPINPAENK